jgi:anti-sigma regulatory factor (Ser/Thr protein kinase)
MPEMTVPIAATPDSPRTARLAVAAFLDLHSADGRLADDVVLVVSELVTNAVLHGSPPIELHVEFEDGWCCRVAVSDADPAHGLAAAKGPFASTGRGLEIVAALAVETGVERYRDAKTVWAEFGGRGRPRSEPRY